MRNLMSDQRKLSNDKKIGLLIAVVWGYTPIALFFNAVINLFYQTPRPQPGTILCFVALILLILISTRSIVRRLKLGDIIFVLCVAIVFLLSMLFFPDNTNEILGIFPTFFFTVFPYYLLGRAVVEFEIVTKYLKFMSMWVILAAIGYNAISLLIGGMLITENMSFAYATLPSVVFISYVFLDKGKIRYGFFVLLGLISLLATGTRGPLVCLLSFFVLFFLVNLMDVKLIITRYVPLFLLTGLFFMGNNSIVWIEKLNGSLMNFNISNRIFRFFLAGQIYNSTGRDDIQGLVVDGIKNHPFWGTGLMGDRLLTEGSTYAGSNGIYAHNILLELWAQFGVVIGTIMIVGLFLLVLRKLLNERNKEARSFTVVLITIGLIELFFSSSYLIAPYLYLLIGVSVKLKESNSDQREADQREAAL